MHTRGRIFFPPLLPKETEQFLSSPMRSRGRSKPRSARSKLRSVRRHASVAAKTSRRRTGNRMSHKKLSRRYQGEQATECRTRNSHEEDEDFVLLDHPVEEYDQVERTLRQIQNGGRILHNGVFFWEAQANDQWPGRSYIWNTTKNDGRDFVTPKGALQLKSLAKPTDTDDAETDALRATELYMLDKFNALKTKTLKSALELMMQEFRYVLKTDKDFTDPSWHALHQFHEDSLKPLLQQLLQVTNRKEELITTQDLYPSGFDNRLTNLEQQQKALGEKLALADDPKVFIKRIFATMRAYKKDWDESYPTKDPLTNEELFALAAFRGAAD